MPFMDGHLTHAAIHANHLSANIGRIVRAEKSHHAISAHYTKWGVSYDTRLDKALLACDELTGFIGACCLVRPEGVTTLTPKSVKKKLKDKGFAAKVERTEVTAGAELLATDLGQHITFIIEALKPHADELGIGGGGA